MDTDRLNYITTQLGTTENTLVFQKVANFGHLHSVRASSHKQKVFAVLFVSDFEFLIDELPFVVDEVRYSFVDKELDDLLSRKPGMWFPSVSFHLQK